MTRGGPYRIFFPKFLGEPLFLGMQALTANVAVSIYTSEESFSDAEMPRQPALYRVFDENA